MDRKIDSVFVSLLYHHLANPPEWMTQGLCTMDTDSDIQSLCDQCPVKKQCYNYASYHEFSSGVFGGEDFSKK